MKVMLNDHVENLGERGDEVTVKPGYARNYLIPKGLAYPNTIAAQRRFEQEQKIWEEMDLKRQSAAEKLAAELTGTELVFERRAGERDVLFGSVSVVDVARALAGKGFELDKRRIQLAEPIKSLGTSTVAVRVYRETDVPIAVHVVRPGEKPGPAPAEKAPPAAPVDAVDTLAAELGVTGRGGPRAE